MKGSVTLARDARMRIFERHIEDASSLYGDTSIYGCLYRANKRILLASAQESFVEATLIRLDAPRVAYLEHSSYTSDGGFQVKVVNLVTRRISQYTVSDVSDLVLAKNGQYAWIDRPQNWSDQRELRWSGGNQIGGSILDAGPDIRPGSLAVAGTTLYWTRGDSPQSAKLG